MLVSARPGNKLCSRPHVHHVHFMGAVFLGLWMHVFAVAGFKSKAIPHCHNFFFNFNHASHAPLLCALYGNCVSVCISSQGWDSNQMRFHIAIIFFSILIYLWHNTLGKEVILLNSYFLFEFVLQKS